MHGMSEEQVERNGSDSTGAFVGGGKKKTTVITKKQRAACVQKIAFKVAERNGRKVPIAADFLDAEKMVTAGIKRKGILICDVMGGNMAVRKGGSITPATYLRLVTRRAETSASGRVPTAKHVKAAETAADGWLAKNKVKVLGGAPKETVAAICGGLMSKEVSGDSTGSFWDHVKAVGRAAFPVMKTTLPAVAIATPIAALVAKQAAKSAATAETQKQAQALEQKKGAEGAEQKAPSSAPPVETSGAFVGRGHHHRRVSSNAGRTMSFNVYRTKVWQLASRYCGGGRPNPACLAKAEYDMQQGMKRRGIVMTIPGARPGRVTRGPSGIRGESETGKFLFWGGDNMKATPDAEGGTLKLLHEGGKSGYKPFKLPSGWSVDEADHANVKGDDMMGDLMGLFGFGSKTVVPYDHEPGYVVLRHQGKKNSGVLQIPDKWKVAERTNTTLSGAEPSNKIVSRTEVLAAAKAGDKSAQRTLATMEETRKATQKALEKEAAKKKSHHWWSFFSGDESGLSDSTRRLIRDYDQQVQNYRKQHPRAARSGRKHF